MPELAAETALLEAAERQPMTEHAVVVDPDGAGPQPRIIAVRAADALRPDAGGESVGRVVGDPHRLLLVR